MKKLNIFRQRISVSKSRYNEFGKYYYRNASDIFTAIKELEEELNCSLTLTTDIVEAGEKAFIKAIATFKDLETNEIEISTAFAAIDEEPRNGMSAAQATGAANTYALKYVLSNMLLLEDGEIDNLDSDSPYAKRKQQELQQVIETPQQPKKANINFNELKAVKTIEELSKYEEIAYQLNSEKAKAAALSIIKQKREEFDKIA